MDGLLTMLTPLKGVCHEDGTIGLTQKFVSGIQEYLKHWDGPIQVLIEPADASTGNLDTVAFNPDELPFSLDLADYHSPELVDHLEKSALVLASLSYGQTHLASLCRKRHLPLVFITEYTLKTRREIVKANISSPLRRTYRELKEIQLEWRQRQAVQLASGIQCNGTPTFLSYRALNRNPLLFFDNRIHADAIISEEALKTRLQRKGPLQLLYSGRLDPMKGAAALPSMIEAFHRQGTPFHFHICGDGSLGPSIQQEIAARGLMEHCTFHGVLDFERELLPFVKEKIDLFICPHVQGDPACTYMETFACGVPILGFANEALSGLCHAAPVGWTVSSGAIADLAKRLHQLDRKAVSEASFVARSLASQHTFEQTFQRRVEHLRSCSV